ncbi:MAG TPA: ABC transporter substrate-binding protein [Stellaceae bacterium]|nr:ABC transporter substrate-binding protein [Stellaceae bacterium]
MAASAIGHAQAQQKAKVYRIAVVAPSGSIGNWTETGTSRGFRAFFGRLRELGYIEGRNLVVERYSAEGRTEHWTEMAGEVVRSNPDLIFVLQYRLVRDFKAATNTIPIVGYGGDPVAFGIVSSLARPGGNITGVTGDTGTRQFKLLPLLREMVPTASWVAYLASPAVWDSPYIPPFREQAQSLKISLLGPPVTPPFDEAEYRRVFTAMATAGADAMIVSDQVENFANRRLIVELAAEYRLPAIYGNGGRDWTDIGGLLSYGSDFPEHYRHAADQVDQILKGAKPGDIPFYQPMKFELTVNANTAKALGLTIPQSILALADEVIE